MLVSVVEVARIVAVVPVADHHDGAAGSLIGLKGDMAVVLRLDWCFTIIC